MTPQTLLRRTLAAVMAALLLVLGSSAAALAHDAVTETSPANGSTVASVPDKIQISLSNSPAVIGSQVLVLDEAGGNWAQGNVDVLDKVATQGIRPGAPAGKYTVQWRLVSSDSHPIEGEFSFTATAAGAAATGGAEVGAGPIKSVEAPTEAAEQPVHDDSSVPWSVFALIAALIIVVVAMVVVARRRLSSDE